jgi:isopentenyl-diphosphate delta-isomerase
MKAAKISSRPATIESPGRDRKAEHIDLALQDRMQVHGGYFEEYVFGHEALPEIDLAEVNLEVSFLGKSLAAPLLISCMTGGTEEATRINHNLAIAAEETGIAIGLGSQRKAIEDPSLVESFQIRSLAPSVPILANLGAVQLNYGFGIDECRAAVEMIDADALVFHLNPLQEALQPEGQGDFSGLITKIGEIASMLEVPVIVKEVGCGISGATARALEKAGITTIDTAGVGGTSWARIEAQRSRDLEIGELFADWGIPTPESIRQLREIPGLTIIGSGGVRNGIEAAKAIALGADLVGMAQPFLIAADESADAVVEKARRVARELKIAMFCVGACSVTELQQVQLRYKNEG